MDKQDSRCAQCRKKLELGMDVITVEAGVIGPRGVVPLGKVALLCCEGCVVDYYDIKDLPQSPQRIP